MPLVTSSIPNLINGISQQPPALRLSSQGEEQINCMPSPVEGLKKRSPMNHIAKVWPDSAGTKRPFVHLVDRDGTSQWIVYIQNGQIKVCDLDGTAYTSANGGIVSPIVTAQGTATQTGSYAQSSGTLVQVTANSHGLVVGDSFTISFASTENAAPGSYIVTNLYSANQFGYQSSTTVVDSGTCYVTKNTSISASYAYANTTPPTNQITLNGHGLNVGDQFTIGFPSGETGAPGVFEVKTVASANQFTYEAAAYINDSGNCQIYKHETEYLRVTGEPSEKFRVASIANFTFIVNREKTVAMSTETSPAGLVGKSMIFIKAANYDTTYKAKINSTEVEFKTEVAGGRVLQASYSQPSGATHVDVTANSHGLVVGDKVDIEFAVGETAINGKYTITHVPSANQFKYAAPSANPAVVDAGNCTVTYDPKLSTVTIAEKLAAQLNAISGFTVTNNEYIINITKDTNADDYTIESTDDRTGEDTKAIKGIVDDMDDLPIIAKHGFIVKVQGSKATEIDDYYVKFNLNNPDSSPDGDFGDGKWKETVAPSIPYKFDASTMPHVLERKVDTSGNITFEFRKHDWTGRIAGDERTAPNPSFINTETPINIENLNLFRNRLVFLASEAAILSAANEYGRFWPETVQAVPDSDPIDLSTGGTSINYLVSSVAFANTLLLFSRHGQFRLDAGINVGSSITPKSTTITSMTTFDMDNSVDPIAVGRNLYFPIPKGSYSGVREFFMPDSSGSVPLSEDITASVPRYIPTNLCSFVASISEEALVLVSKDQPKRLYLYKFFYEDDTKLQSSWSYWEASGSKTILGAGMIDSDLYALVEYSDGVYLEHVVLRPENVDVGTDLEILLDRKTTESETGISTTLINPGALGVQTTITLPYPIAAGAQMVVVGRYEEGNTGTVTNTGSYAQSSGTLVQVTDNSHGLTVGDSFTISFAEGENAAPGSYVVTNVYSANQFGYQSSTTVVDAGTCYITQKTKALRHGQVIEPLSQTSNSITVPGDLKTVVRGKTPRYFIGERYDMTYEFSTPYIKEQPAGGGVALASGPKLQMRTWTVIFDESSAFELKVTPASRDTNTYPYNGIIVGEAPPSIGDPSVLTGSFRVPVMTSNIDTKIVISSTSPLPCRFQSAEWEGFYHTRAKRT